MNQAYVSDQGGEGDIKEGEARASVSNNGQHRISGNVLDIERAEATALAKRGQCELEAGLRGQEGDPGS